MSPQLDLRLADPLKSDRQQIEESGLEDRQFGRHRHEPFGFHKGVGEMARIGPKGGPEV